MKTFFCKYFFSAFLPILFFSSFFLESTLAQSFISPGNRWDYVEGWWDGTGNGDKDTNSYYAANDTILQNGKTYQRISPGNILFNQFFRIDTSGVWVYDFQCSEEFLYFSYSAPIGEEYLVNCDTSQQFPKVVKMADTISTIFNEQLRIITYSFDTGMDNSYTTSISPELGFISYDNSVPFVGMFFGNLMGCIINDEEYGTLITDVKDFNAPFEFSLSQNYPNPFNPSTIINYSIPVYSNVIINIYDVIGNEIQTLINEEKTAGEYQLTWNASELPSGVYFYQIRAGAFLETKKMILMR